MVHLRKRFLSEERRTEASQQTSIQARFRFGDVLSATPSARTPGSRGCREYISFSALSVQEMTRTDLIGNSVCQSIADTIISNYEV